MSTIDDATVIANLRETMERLIAERDELREIVSSLGMYVVASEMDETTRKRWREYSIRKGGA